MGTRAWVREEGRRKEVRGGEWLEVSEDTAEWRDEEGSQHEGEGWSPGKVMSDWGGTRAQQHQKGWSPRPGWENCCGMFFYSLATTPVGSQDDSQRQRGPALFFFTQPPLLEAP